MLKKLNQIMYRNGSSNPKQDDEHRVTFSTKIIELITPMQFASRSIRLYSEEDHSPYNIS